jgi:hypothetical protein
MCPHGPTCESRWGLTDCLIPKADPNAYSQSMQADLPGCQGLARTQSVQRAKKPCTDMSTSTGDKSGFHTMELVEDVVRVAHEEPRVKAQALVERKMATNKKFRPALGPHAERATGNLGTRTQSVQRVSCDSPCVDNKGLTLKCEHELCLTANQKNVSS